MLVFDLDQTVINSLHRTPLDANGKVIISEYVKRQTEDYIMQDTLLPLANLMQQAYINNIYIIICTARNMTIHDYNFLSRNNLQYNEIFERGNVPKEISNLPDAQFKTKCLNKFKNMQYTFYDDSDEVIELFRTYPNVTMIDSKELNEEIN